LYVPPSHKLDRTVTYHHACHLAHAQKVTEPPLELLGWIDGLTVVSLAEADMCCGAGGTYNLTQPDMARQLAERKLGHIKDSGANICVAGNVGCAMQIQSEADRLGMPLTVEHTVALLHEAYFGRRSARLGAGV
jgi:glycolate oxidase iron-sulfur subunit